MMFEALWIIGIWLAIWASLDKKQNSENISDFYHGGKNTKHLHANSQVNRNPAFLNSADNTVNPHPARRHAQRIVLRNGYLEK
jgi:hypothetical protein